MGICASSDAKAATEVHCHPVPVMKCARRLGVCMLCFIGCRVVRSRAVSAHGTFGWRPTPHVRHPFSFLQQNAAIEKSLKKDKAALRQEVKLLLLGMCDTTTSICTACPSARCLVKSHAKSLPWPLKKTNPPCAHPPDFRGRRVWEEHHREADAHHSRWGLFGGRSLGVCACHLPQYCPVDASMSVPCFELTRGSCCIGLCASSHSGTRHVPHARASVHTSPRL